MTVIPFLTRRTISPRRRWRSGRAAPASATGTRAWLAGILAVLACVVSVSPADAAPSGWYHVPYDDDVFFTHNHVELGINGRADEHTRAQWEAAGSPATAEAPTRYVKHSWSPTIYALIALESGGVEPAREQLRALAPAQWQHARFPVPSIVPVVPQDRYHKWVYSDEIFVQAIDRGVHKLSYEEWSAAGFPEPRVRTRGGYAKLSWAPGIAYMYAPATGNGSLLTPDEWAKAGHPTPREVVRFPNDLFCRDPWSLLDPFDPEPVLYYGPTYRGPVTQDQISAAGGQHGGSCHVGR